MGQGHEKVRFGDKVKVTHDGKDGFGCLVHHFRSLGLSSFSVSRDRCQKHLKQFWPWHMDFVPQFGNMTPEPFIFLKVWTTTVSVC